MQQQKSQPLPRENSASKSGQVFFDSSFVVNARISGAYCRIAVVDASSATLARVTAESEAGSVPEVVIALASGEPLQLAWENGVGGRTYQVGTGERRRFVKWSPHASGIDLAKEVVRLRWAGAYTAVPRVLDRGADETAAWMVTASVRGESAVSDRWKADPATAVAQIGVGLRALHDALPIDTCPFSWAVDDRLVATKELDARGLVDETTWGAEERSLGIDGVLKLLADPPAIDKLVVCHGDACSPNTLLTDDGQWSGHVDLGNLGVADRWADLAVATMSTEWNYGPGWESTLLDAYGIAPDRDRTWFYRLLWNCGDASEQLRRLGP
jgi:kanamycin kinase